jgi:hypothetical protein
MMLISGPRPSSIPTGRPGPPLRIRPGSPWPGWSLVGSPGDALDPLRDGTVAVSDEARENA